jgi:hypothetical protein
MKDINAHSRKTIREVSTSKLNVVDGKDLLMVSLAKFYSTKNLMQQIIPIIDSKSEISLRLIDWFVTNYSKKNSTIITRTVDNNIVHFNVYLSYRSQLKAYSKHQFDPFRRRERIKFYYDREKALETTIGQLNFFRWVLQNGILEYITGHIHDIENDMISSQKENCQQKKLSSENPNNISSKSPCLPAHTTSKSEIDVQKRKKRNELSKSFVKNMNRFDGARMISFD